MTLTFLRLIKYKLSLAVTLTCLSAYIIHSKEADLLLLLTVTAVFVLACGLSVLNQYQERRSDALMQRTSSRPLPQGAISPVSALFISILLIIIGLTILLYLSLTAFFSGILALLLYNGLYTRLKPISYLAIIPGALVGTIPPVIGWTVSGGSLTDPALVYLSFLIFMWQIPHFWILLVRFHKDYREAGYPTIIQKTGESQLKRIVFIWVSLSSLFAITYSFFNIKIILIVSYIIIILVITFVIVFFYLLFRKSDLMRAFIISNVFITILYILFALGSLPYKI